MCGIVGFVNNTKEKTFLGNILQSLEDSQHRGFDNSGVAIQTNNEVVCFKTVGDATKLREKINGLNESYESRTGIGHTRWATHGNRENELNSHPHYDFSEDIWVAHNGTIDNYKLLKAALIEEASKRDDFEVNFYSETDTEVIPNLIKLHYIKTQDLFKAVSIACNELSGAFAIVVMHKNEPNRLVAATNSSSLHIVKNDDFIGVCSDLGSMVWLSNIDHKRLELNQIVDINNDTFKISSLNGALVKDCESGFTNISLEELIATKGDYRHYMLKEIMEQPTVLERVMLNRLVRANNTVRLGGPESIVDKLEKIKKIYIIATGSSSYAAEIGKLFFKKIAHIETIPVLSSEFEDNFPIIDDTTCVIAISQSGETKDTMDALQEAIIQRAVTMGIVNDVGTAIPAITDAGVYMRAGKEKGVAATKTFTSQIIVQLMLALFMGRLNRTACSYDAKQIIDAMYTLPELLQETIDINDEKIKALAAKYRDIKNIMVFGKGYNYPVALEAALKLKEICKLPVMGHSAGDAKHGPIAMCDKELLCIPIIPQDTNYEKVLLGVTEFASNNARIMAISNSDCPNLSEMCEDVIVIPRTIDMLSPVLSIACVQLFSYYLSLELGLDPDRPENLAKSVTVN